MLLTPGFSVDGEEYTGVHVAINDGVREVRAAILGTDGAGVRVALKLETGYSRGFVLPTTQATFQVKRLADGTGVLAVSGQTPETVPRLQLRVPEGGPADDRVRLRRHRSGLDQ